MGQDLIIPCQAEPAIDTSLPNPVPADRLTGGVRLRMTTEPETARAAWQALEQTGLSTLYQSWGWCAAWRDTVGRARGIVPVVVTGEDAAGRPLFVLPLQIEQRFGARLLQWQSWPHGSYGYGLYERAFLAQAPDWFQQHGAELAAVLPPFDLWLLQDMPETLHGARHPLAGLFNVRGANVLYAMDLRPDFAALYEARRSGDSRRSARKRDSRLGAMGSLTFGLPEAGAATHDVLDQMFTDQQKRLAEAHIQGPFDAAAQAFIHRLADVQAGDGLVLQPYALRLDGRLLCVMLGAVQGGCYWALISSLAAGPERKHSPGDMALRRMIEACCAQGLHSLDFASGDTAYKRQWADRVVPLHGLVRAQTARGVAFRLPWAAYYHAKRVVKGSPVLRAVYNRLRSVLPRPV